MEAQYRAFNGRLVIKVEGANIKDIFKAISPIAEVLDQDQVCGACKSPNIRLRHRVTTKGRDSFDYYELACGACSARLELGQLKQGGGLFPKRKDDNGYLPNFGWTKYQGADHETE